MCTKPECQLTGTDGNIFALMGKASRTLKRDGQPEKAKEMSARIMSEAKNYNEALDIIGDYVEVM